jgi:hypothetical protein
MFNSIDACVRERSLPKDRASSVIEKREAQSSSHRSGTSYFISPARSSKTDLEDLEFSDVGRDPRFTNGRWLGLAILIAVAFCAVYLGFVSVWAALALTILS